MASPSTDVVPGGGRDARRLRPVLPAAEPEPDDRGERRDPLPAAVRTRRSCGPTRVPPARRLTIYVDEVPGLDATDVSAAFTSLNAVPIIVERAMYYSPAGDAVRRRPRQRRRHRAVDAVVPRRRRHRHLLRSVRAARQPDGGRRPTSASPTCARPARRSSRRARSRPTAGRRSTSSTRSRAGRHAGLDDRRVAQRGRRSSPSGRCGGRRRAAGRRRTTRPARRPPPSAGASADGEVGNPPFNTQTYFLIANTGDGAGDGRA